MNNQLETQHTGMMQAVESQLPDLRMKPSEAALIVRQFQERCPKATPEMAVRLLYTAETRQLNPLMNHIYGMVFFDKQQQRDVLNIITGVDGFRLIAQRTGRYLGLEGSGIEYMRDNSGKVMAARCCVLRELESGAVARFPAEVFMKDYHTGKNLWQKMPDVMIGKVAEVHAIRRGFPEAAGLYSPEEMEQAQSDQPTQQPVNVTPAKEPPKRKGKAEIAADARAAIAEQKQTEAYTELPTASGTWSKVKQAQIDAVAADAYLALWMDDAWAKLWPGEDWQEVGPDTKPAIRGQFTSLISVASKGLDMILEEDHAAAYVKQLDAHALMTKKPDDPMLILIYTFWRELFEHIKSGTLETTGEQAEMAGVEQPTDHRAKQELANE